MVCRTIRFPPKAEKAKRGNERGAFYKNALSAFEIYRGEFMSGVYDDWAEERRNYFSEQFSRTLCSLAEYSFEEHSWQDAHRYSNEALKYDPFREDMHRLIMKTFAAEGSAAGVKKQFDSLKNLLQKELGVDPATETLRLHQELLG